MVEEAVKDNGPVLDGEKVLYRPLWEKWNVKELEGVSVALILYYILTS